MAMIFDVSEGDFEQRVVERSREVPVVVDFWASWCGPCRTLGPAIQSAVKARDGKVDLAKVDVDANQLLAASFGIKGIPAVKAFRDGKVAAEFTGALPPARIEEFLDRLVPSEADELVSAGDEESLRRALELDPGHGPAAVLLGRKLIARGELDDARTLLSDIQGDFIADGLRARIELESGEASDGIEPQALAEAFSAWDAGDPGAALEQLQQAFAETHDEGVRNRLRQVMVAIFTELGPDHELARTHRRRLAAALN